MSEVQLVVDGQEDVQIAVIDQQNTQIALAFPDEISLNLAVPGTQGPVGVGFPASGGTIHQLLVKNSSADFDATWSSVLEVSSLTINDGTY
jgi:hypothetical protein